MCALRLDGTRQLIRMHLFKTLRSLLTAFLLMATLLGVTLQAQTLPTLDAEESAFLNLINAYRAQNGAGPLQVSIALQNSSTWMANDMAAHNLVDHTDSLGRGPQQRINVFGYTYFPWGENIAGGYGDAQSAFNQWVNACDADSSGSCTFAHRVNMLNPRFVVMGIGRAYLSTSIYKYYWATDFGGFLDQTIGGGATPAAKPVINSFSASSYSTIAGQPLTLSWSVSGATAISIDNGVGDVTGSNAITVSPNQPMTYTLTGSNGSGSSSASVSIAVTQRSDGQPPSTPVLISAAAKSGTEIDLAWSASSDNVGVAGYQIFRNGAALASVPGYSVTYADLGAGPSSSYSYAVKAYDAAGNYSSLSNSLQVSTPAPVPANSGCPGPLTGAFSACYYNNTTLSGNPALVRTDNQINFDWGSGSPDKSLAPYNFSARWQGYFNLSPGDYTFTAITSDGMRVFVDGLTVLDRWRDQPPNWYTVHQTLTGGTHLIVVEYYERTGGAVAQVSWLNNNPVVQPPPVVLAFAASAPSIAPVSPVTLSWNVSGATSVTIDNGVGDVTNRSSVSVSPAQTTSYTLRASNSAGTTAATVTVAVTAAVDSTPPTSPTLVSAIAKSFSEVDLTWSASSDNVGVTGYQVLRNGAVAGVVSAGTLSFADTGVAANSTYLYMIKAFDAAGNYSAPSNSVQVATPGQATGTCAAAAEAFTGCYYNNTALTGSPVLIRTDKQINFDWSYSPLDPALSPNNFSARWQGNFTFAAGNYTFNLIGSDGMRLYIDGSLVLDRWRDQSSRWYKTSQTLSQGTHLLVVEYYEKTGTPALQLFWQ